MIEADDADDDGSRWEDLGFEIPGEGTVWLNRSRASDTFPLNIDIGAAGVVKTELLSKAIVAQKLLPTILDKPKRVPITEIMIFNGTIRKLILEEQDEKLPAAIRIGKQEGMMQFNDSLYHFVTKEFVSRAEAFEISPNVEELKMMLKGITVKSSGIL